jgi:hypothetical protein
MNQIWGFQVADFLFKLTEKRTECNAVDSIFAKSALHEPAFNLISAQAIADHTHHRQPHSKAGHRKAMVCTKRHYNRPGGGEHR